MPCKQLMWTEGLNYDVKFAFANKFRVMQFGKLFYQETRDNWNKHSYIILSGQNIPVELFQWIKMKEANMQLKD